MGVKKTTVSGTVKPVKPGEANKFVITLPDHLNALYQAIADLSAEVARLKNPAAKNPAAKEPAAKESTPDDANGKK